MKAYTLKVCVENSEKEFCFSSKENREWFLEEVEEWVANSDVSEVHEYVTISEKEAVDWQYDLPPREYQLRSCQKYLTPATPRL